MSFVEPGEAKHEIVIVRRAHNDDDEGHHGGVWKIAFADFMTAMMCFFLVMWLINASDDKTRAAVASYFNPIKLIDRNSSRKGLEELGDGPYALGMDKPLVSNGESGTEGRGNAGPTTEKNSADSTETLRHSDQHLFAEPYAVLAEIAGDTGVRQNVSVKGDGGAQSAGPSTGASGGEAYRDPFAPDFWSQEVAAMDTAAASPAPEGMAADPQTDDDPPPAELDEMAEPAAISEPPALPTPQPLPDPVEDPLPSPEIEKAAAEIRKELDKAFAPGEKLAEGLSITAGEDGVTVSVTDQLDFGMFEIGSAVPRRELVLAMEKIARALGARKGTIAIGGHTDGRPFKSEAYDNWRLSTARAHSAYYMLVRAGLDETRIAEVAGHADRRLKDAADPLAAGNRRIEILLEIDG